jgi:hypothetical protein
VSLNLNLNPMAYSVRLPQFWWKTKTPAISCDQGSISKYLFLGFGASWVPPHSASIVSAGEKNLGGWWAFQQESHVGCVKLRLLALIL